VGTPRLLLVTRSRDVYELFCRQIRDVFADRLAIFDAAVTGTHVEADLVLSSYREAVKEHDLPADRLMVARRTVDLTKVSNLVELPSGTRCLVVNNSLDTARETITCLENLGLDLELIPHNPASPSPPEGVEIALVAETGREFVPAGIRRTVDIGLRPLDYATLLEIGFRLGISVENSQVYSSTYIRQIVQLSWSLSQALKSERRLNSQMDAIFQTVHDGLVAIAKDGRVLQANRAAYRILGLKQGTGELLGRRLHTLIPAFPKLEDISADSTIHHVGESYLVVNRTDVDEGELGSVIAFQDVTKLQKLEHDFRRKVQSKGLLPRYSEEDIVACSQAMDRVLQVVRKIARTDRTVLILGESGTGKELIAHALHRLSARSHGPFLPVNFAGLPATLAESEVFGYEDGAFTGARRGGKPGIFELAHNGTLFLDEIGDAPPSIQALLLRVLQERQVMRIGGDRVIPIDVRIVAATNRDLLRLVREGKFREDLYYRLFVLPLYVPPLRDRKEDILPLAQHFLNKYGRRSIRFSDAVTRRLTAYDWPGNVRELESVVQYMVSVADGEELRESHLPPQLLGMRGEAPSPGRVCRAGEGGVHWGVVLQESSREVAQARRPVDEIGHAAEAWRQLEACGLAADAYAILSALHWAEANGVGALGRAAIALHAQRYGRHLSEQQVRLRLDMLRQMDLVAVGTRRQGTRLTELGEIVLAFAERSRQETTPVGMLSPGWAE
jgi:transcriptional regulator with PAS, ATPase and Fis domain